MATPEASQHDDHGPAHPEAPHGRTFPVRIDDHEVLLHEQHPTGRDLLAAVGKKPCAFDVISLFKHDERRTIGANETVDLGHSGVDKFVTAHKDIVDIMINDNPFTIARGGRTVAEILAKVGQTPEGYALLAEKDGPPLPLPANQPVHVKGCEVFHTQVNSGASS